MISTRGGEESETPGGTRLPDQGTGPSLHLDARFGIAGDMLLSALLDLLEADGGESPSPTETVFAPFSVSSFPPHRRELTRVSRHGLAARHFRVDSLESSPPHRGLATILSLIEEMPLLPRARRLATEAFERLAAAEGRVHGISPEQVHFHEVGAVDSLVDIIGVCQAIALLDPAQITVSPLPLGSGTVKSAHGVIPIPAPATLELLRGIPTEPFGEGEVTTPTGAVLAATLADRWGDPESGSIGAIGVGAGTRIAPATAPPNILRAWTILPAGGATRRETVSLLETHLDTVTGEEAGSVIPALLGAGALDAWWTAGTGKKGRPSSTLTVLVPPGLEDPISAEIFRRTGTLGIRRQSLEREILPREVRAETFGEHTVRIKRAWWQGTLLWERPEQDDLAAVAAATGESPREVRARIDAELARRRGENLR